MTDEITENKTPSASTTINAQVNFQETNTLNVNQGLSLPSVEHIHAVEQYSPGFMNRTIEAWQKQGAHRQELELRQLKEEYSYRNNLESIKHEFYMFELKQEDGRLTMFTSAIVLLMVAFAIAGIVFFALKNHAAGYACVAACSLPGLASILHAAKNRPRAK